MVSNVNRNLQMDFINYDALMNTFSSAICIKPHLTLDLECLQIVRLREGVGIATNNVAEYRGAILGLKYALQSGYKHIRIQGDSKLVCMQVIVQPYTSFHADINLMSRCFSPSMIIGVSLYT